MANGNSVNHFHSYGNWSTSTSGKNFTVTLTCGMGSESWGFSIGSGITGTANIDGTARSVSTGFSSGRGASVNKDIVSVSKTFTRGHSAANKSLSWSVVNSSGYMNGTSSGSATVTVPALAAHTITFNANGGTGGPSTYTKYEYEDLTIPSSKPTRTNYEFLGWSRTSTGSVEYEAGKTYNGTKDENYTLYAVWKIVYIAPSFSSVLAFRTSSATSSDNVPMGGYAYASMTWKVDTTVYSSNKLKTLTCAYYKDGSTTATSVTPSGTASGTSGTINLHFAAVTSSTYRIVVSVTDTQGGTTTAERTVSAANYPLDIANKGASVGILHSAPSATNALSLGGVTLTDVNSVSGTYPMSDLKSVLDNAHYVTCARMYCGSIIRGMSTGTDSTIMFTKAQLESMFGVTSAYNIAAAATNGDANAFSGHCEGTTMSGGNLYAVFNKYGTGGSLRINYMIFAW